ncbi:MAG: shikimate dehydrogenase family protein [Parvularculaceae bacterium]
MSAAPRLAGVIGWPIGHSLSPNVHAYWAARENALAHYIPITAAPDDASFRRVVEGLCAAGFRGLNVTVPHKERALRYADEASDLARRVGAANMLTFDGDRARADNSDVEGFAEALRAAAPDGFNAARALVLGAGGAARADAVALKTAFAAHVTVKNRTGSRADDLVAEGLADAAAPWGSRNETQADVFVNATSLGMEGSPPLDVDFAAAAPGAAAVDIVYRPLETAFLANARRAGLIAVDGLEMLLRQAVPGYLRWLGDAAPVDNALREAIRARLTTGGAKA